MGREQERCPPLPKSYDVLVSTNRKNFAVTPESRRTSNEIVAIDPGGDAIKVVARKKNLAARSTGILQLIRDVMGATRRAFQVG